MTHQTDRELLELAAKAARAFGSNIIDTDAGPQIFERYASNGAECFRVWCPHADDAESFRLAVLLNISFNKAQELDLISARIRRLRSVFTEPIGGDPYATTRRVVLVAAAEIGRAMP